MSFLLVVVLLLASAATALAQAVTPPPVPTVLGPIAGPGRMYPDPPVSVVADSPQVEDFPYITEEYFVSGTAGGQPYTTRIIIRRPETANTLRGQAVEEALTAGRRSLVIE